MIEETYQEGLKSVRRLGTWLFYFVRDARHLEHLVGWMTYHIEGLERRRGRLSPRSVAQKERRKTLTRAITDWRRAARWVSTLDPAHHGLLAERMLELLENERPIDYVIDSQHHPVLTKEDRPPKRAGRPRSNLPDAKSVERCARCGGMGYVASADAG